MTILPLAYLPSVEYFAHLLRGGCVVDLGEHFVKRSERNRARILATDGVMELTDPYALPDPNSTSAAVNFWAIRWRQFDVNGTAWPVFTTYHNVRDGWYFILPDEWENKIAISRSDLASSGERAVVFSYWEGDAAVDPAPFLVIYQLTGDNRYMRANMTGRFRLHTGAEDAARFVDCDWDCGLDETGVQENFALIVSDWSVTT